MGDLLVAGGMPVAAVGVVVHPDLRLGVGQGWRFGLVVLRPVAVALVEYPG